MLIIASSLFGEDCYDKNRIKTFELFEKAFKHSEKIKIKNLFWRAEQVNNSIIMTFDGKDKRGLIWYDKKCNPTTLKVSAGRGLVTMYYYKVNGKKIKLLKTRKNKY